MNLSDATSLCKNMVTQLNTHSLIPIHMTEEDDVIERTTYSSRSFKKYDVWQAPGGEHLQIWNILFADTSGAYASIWTGYTSTQSGSPSEIGIVFMDKNGVCRSVSATAINNAWSKIEYPDIFWRNHWAKILHDVSNGVSRSKPDLMQSSYGGLSAGNTIEVVGSVLTRGIRGSILSFISYKNNYGHLNDPMVLIGDMDRSGLSHVSDFKDVILSGSTSTYVDSRAKKKDTEGDMMLKFFASSQHDPSSPWFNKEKKEKK